MDSDLIIKEAREWIGTPFRHQTSKKGVFTDCIGFVHGVGKAVGADVPDEIPAEYRGYGRFPTDDTLRKVLDTYTDKVPMSQVQPGDILLIHYSMFLPQHVGFTTGKTIIHAYRKCTEHRLSNAWRRRICGAYRFR